MRAEEEERRMMEAVVVLARLAEAGFSVEPDRTGERLLVRPRAALTQEMEDAIGENKVAILAELRRREVAFARYDARYALVELAEFMGVAMRNGDAAGMASYEQELYERAVSYAKAIEATNALPRGNSEVG
jgi:hypothetical protein